MIRQLLNLIGIGQVTVVDDSQQLQLLQVTERAEGQGFADRVLDKVVRFVEFGFASAPPIGSEALMLRRNGDRAQSMVIATGHRESRPTDLKPGDCCLYDIRGTRILLDENGITIHTATLPIVIDGATTVTIKASENVRIEADRLEVTGDVVSRADGTPVSLNGLRDAYHDHKHSGVSSGSSTTGPTDHEA